jgi:hypothetical protein
MTSLSLPPKRDRVKQKQNQSSETAINTALPSSPTPESHVSGSSAHKTDKFLTTPRQKIPPVVIHHHFQGNMTKLNKDFHSKFQPTGFTTYRIKAGIAC